LHLDVDAAAEQRLDELEREAALAAEVERLAAVGDGDHPILHLELDVTIGALDVGEPYQCDRVAGGDLDPVPIEARRGRAIEQFLQLHQEVPNHRRHRHRADPIRLSIRSFLFVG
jgi:hypothetical protein